MRTGTRSSSVKLLFALISIIIMALSVVLLISPNPELALAPSFGIVGLLVLWKKPLWVYYIIVFLFPFWAFRSVGGVKLHWVFSLLLASIIFFQSVITKRIPQVLFTRLWIWLLVFLFLNLVSTLLSPFKDEAMSDFNLLVVSFSFIALGLMVLDKHGLISTLPKVIVTSISISALFALFGYLTNQSMERQMGGAKDPNNFALLCTFTFPFIFNWLLNAKSSGQRLFFIMLLLMHILGIISTSSRGGGIAMIVMFSMIFFTNLPKLKARYMGPFLALLCIIAGAGMLLVPAEYWERQKSIAEEPDRSISRRTSYLYASRDMFLERPVIGFGTGTFDDYYAVEYGPKWVPNLLDKRRRAHNTYMEVLTGSGFPGLMVFLTIIYLCLRSLHRAKKNFLAVGDGGAARIIDAYKLSFIILLLYLMIFSDLYHKYFLLSLTVAPVALYISKQALAAREMTARNA